MDVLIPSPLLSYTKKPHVQANGATLADVIADLDRQFPGIRFRMVDEQDRMRPHIRFFVNQVQSFDLSETVTSDDEVQIVQALSGG
jgi:molybdopterin converting factor small subunit